MSEDQPQILEMHLNEVIQRFAQTHITVPDGRQAQVEHFLNSDKTKVIFKVTPIGEPPADNKDKSKDKSSTPKKAAGKRGSRKK